MKNSILVLLFVVSYFSYSQKFYDENNFDNYVDYSNKTLKLSYNSYDIEGDFIFKQAKSAAEYIIVQGKNNIHWVIKPMFKSEFYGLDILEGDYSDVLKEFGKGRKYKKVKILFSNLPSEKRMDDLKLVSQTIMEMRLKSKKRKEENEKLAQKFDKELQDSNFIGIYKVKIFKHGNIDYSSYETFGELVITEVGITFTSSIPSLDLLRGSFDKPKSKSNEGSFVCNISKGYGDLFSLVLNKERGSGGLTITTGNRTDTTTFMIIN